MSRSGQDLVEMISRIPNATLGEEFKEYCKRVAGVQEARDLMQHFLEFYARPHLKVEPIEGPKVKNALFDSQTDRRDEWVSEQSSPRQGGT